ncbi:MAG: 50S ribosomal protein L17 [Thermotoga petrophila]|uniref:Large ribosomal subunit protein bL17 n=1 Tax=Thermotoga petrophila TaxID=93929 RepID=A0A117L2H8_9THEM|nr:MAG: 50S ribosomal protein L17 [Thermotoga petrophila]HBU00578.1 50S ribosomal protein L17 [Thermotoga petrophila]
MRHRVKRHRLGRYGSHRKSLLRNLSREIVEHGSIVTTTAKAKALKIFMDKLVSKAIEAATTDDRAKSVHLRRQINAVLGDRRLTNKLVDEIAKNYIGRRGGYVRVLRIGFRRGDAAEMSLVQLVEASSQEG